MPSLPAHLRLLLLSNTVKEAALQTSLLIEQSYIFPGSQLSPLQNALWTHPHDLSVDTCFVPTGMRLRHVQKGRTIY